MPMQAWKAKIRPGGKGLMIDVQIQANNASDAKRLLEAQYGKGNVIFGPSRA